MINQPTFGPLLAEGKTKQIYAYPGDDTLAYMINKDQITPDVTFDSLGADSLDKLEIVMKLEETFGIEINDEDAAKINSIKEAIDKIQQVRTKVHSMQPDGRLARRRDFRTNLLRANLPPGGMPTVLKFIVWT